MTREQILLALAAWVKQRPGLGPRDYGSRYAYREIAQDRRDAETLLTAVRLRPSIPTELLVESFRRAYSGRLTLSEVGGEARLEYCTGQYWPTEYRKAVAAVLAYALWEWQRANMPSKIVENGEDYYPHANGSRNVQRAGDWLRTRFRREFGSSIQKRWFQ